MTTTTSATISTSVTVSSGETATSDMVVNGGTLTILSGGVESGSTIAVGGKEVVTAGGSASGDQIYGIVSATGAGASVSNETIQSGGFLSAMFSQVSGTIANITVDSGGTLKDQGTGTVSNVVLNGGGTLEAGGGMFYTTGTLTFAGGHNTFKFDVSASQSQLLSGGTQNAASIAGFSPTDKIWFAAMSGLTVSEIVSGGSTIATVMSGAKVIETFTFNSAVYNGALSLQTDAQGGTDLVTSVACYCRGTMILTDQGEKPVERLAIGDRLITASGAARPIKWIGTRSYGGRFMMGQKDILPVCVKTGAIADGVPHRDLWISPHHAMYLDGVLIEVKDLVNGVTIVQSEHADHVDYYHVELDSHDVIIAEGALSESFIDDDNRGMFHNAHEYAELYSPAAASDTRYCAPRVDEGYALEVAARSIALRAGLGEERPAIGALEGYIDFIGPDRIEGWARNVDYPQVPVCLDILAGGKLIGQTLAYLHRSDLEGASRGPCAFAFNLPAGFAVAPNAIEVRRSLDGRVLSLSSSGRRVWRKKPTAA